MDLHTVNVRHDRCRLCRYTPLLNVFRVGDQYVSDFVEGEEAACAGPKCPIEIVRCPNCFLVQQRYTAPQQFLYSRHYWYRSGVTQMMKDALRDVTAAAEKRVRLEPGDVVLDIGSNDGTLLRSYGVNPNWPSDGLVRVGVEPADNMRTYYKGTGEPFLIPEFWSAKAYNQYMTHGKLAKVITAIGMFYDLEDPLAFVKDVAAVLHPEGLFVAQLMCLKQTLAIGDVGNLAHEHLEFYTLLSLNHLYDLAGLTIVEIEENAVNGGSYRIYARKKLTVDHHYPIKKPIGWVDETEIDDHEKVVAGFARMEANRRQVAKFILDEAVRGRRTWVYGASTKGNVMLQYWGLSRTVLDGAADRSPEKHGKYMVGSGVRIYPETEFRAAAPAYALVLPYSFLPEILEREREWREGGGKFIVPLPEFRVI